MAELAEKNPNIKTAYAVLRELSEDEKIRRLAEAREKKLRDEAAALDYASQKGEERGEKKAKEEDASNLKALGVDIAIIAQATGITKERIEEL
jgi:predicted transposase/invertase (TIGR01784 family)